MKKALSAILFVFLVSLPLNLIVVQTSVCLCACLLIFGRLRNTWTFSRTPLDLPMLLFILAAVGSLLATDEQIFSAFSSTSFWVFLAYFPLSQAFIIAGSGPWLRRALYVTLGAATAVALYAIWQHFTGADLFGVSQFLDKAPNDPHRFKAIAQFTRHTTLAFTLTSSIILAAAVFLEERRAYAKMVLAVVAALMVTALFFTYVRMAWLGLGAALLMFGLLRTWKIAAVGLAALAVAGGIAIAMSPSVLQKLTRVDTSTDYFPSRNFIWKETLGMVRDHPVAGIGYGNYTPQAKRYFDRHLVNFSPRCHAHNLYLHLWCEGGFLLLVAFMYVWFRFFGAARALLTAPADPRATSGAEGVVMAAAGAAACVLAGSIAQDMIFDGQVVFYLIGIVAAGMAACSRPFPFQHGSNPVISRARTGAPGVHD